MQFEIFYDIYIRKSGQARIVWLVAVCDTKKRFLMLVWLNTGDSVDCAAVPGFVADGDVGGNCLSRQY